MLKIDYAIQTIDKNICHNIEHFHDVSRGLLSQNILKSLRELVEHTSLKAFSNGEDIDVDYDNIKKANEYVKTNGKLKFLREFHSLLQISVSHYLLDQDSAERLMLKYYEYMLKIKKFLNEQFNIQILSNINKFPIYLDSNLQEYYEKIARKIENPTYSNSYSDYTDRYYIHKIKPFFVDEYIYYEVTFIVASDHSSKFDRVIAFTKLDIMKNYSVKFSIRNDVIDVLGKEMPIQIIENYEVSIRPCEINNFSKILGQRLNITSGYREYQQLMLFIHQTGMGLNELVTTKDSYYQYVRSKVLQKIQKPQIFGVLDRCREIILKGIPGANILKYLLHNMNNKIIKSQYWPNQCKRLSNLCLDYGCIPFDEMPFNSSLKNHNPRLQNVLECIDTKEREHEFLARYIQTNTETEGHLFTSINDISDFDNVEDLIRIYNKQLYIKHGNRKLKVFKNNIYTKGYVEDTVEIIDNLISLSKMGIENYSDSFEYWLREEPYVIDCQEKEKALINMFDQSNVALIYGAAGTGKTTLINHISNFFNDDTKVFLANTNPAVDNLKQKVHALNSSFYTVAKFLSDSHGDTGCDVLIIDECSTVSNKDMREILDKATFNLIILVGDVYQIESIRFGNWFELARHFMPKNTVFELEKPYRTKNENLLRVWKSVRNNEDNILEFMTRNNYSASLDNTIFDSSDEDEIVLCLNYDGLYGINNINTFLQQSNPNDYIQWGVKQYKIGDPVLFNETNRFHPLIYNNAKGIIHDIEVFNTYIRFDIQLDKPLNEFEARGYDFELIHEEGNPNSIIRFYVSSIQSTDEDDDRLSDDIVPFQVAYAVSIHKAQGLEYDSVKVVITDEVNERITHNIFYTAITRSRENLKVYWTPETSHKILQSFDRKSLGKDIGLLSNKYGLKRGK